jgi:hypothetical protein
MMQQVKSNNLPLPFDLLGITIVPPHTPRLLCVEDGCPLLLTHLAVAAFPRVGVVKSDAHTGR